MQRYEVALMGIAVRDSRTFAVIAPLLRRFTHAARDLKRALTPLNGSVHAAISRAVVTPGDGMTTIHWVSVYDRVGLFDFEDNHVSRLMDSALLYAWRKEEADAFVSEVVEDRDRVVSQRLLTDARTGAPRAGDREDPEVGGGSGVPQKMRLHSLRSREIFSVVPPPDITEPHVDTFSAIEKVVEMLSKSNNSAILAREYGMRVLTAYLAILLANADLSVADVLKAERLRTAKRLANKKLTTATVAAPPTSVTMARTGHAHRTSATAPALVASGVAPSAVSPAAAVANRNGRGNGDRTGDGAPAFAAAGAAPSAVVPSAAAANGNGRGNGDGTGNGAPALAAAGAAPSAVPPAAAAANDNGRGSHRGGRKVVSPSAGGAAAAVGSGNGCGDADVALGLAATGAPSSAAATAPELTHGTLTSLAEHKDGGSLGFRCLTMYGHCKWCPTWTCSNGGKGITPLGTKANPRGKCSVKHFRSVWGHRVTLHAIKPLDTAATQSGRLLKLDADEVLVVDMTDLSSKSVADVLAILLFLRANESDARRVVQETAAEGMTARLSRNRSLVHSGLNLDSLSKHPAREDGRPAGTAPSSGGGVGGSDAVFNDHGGPGEGQRLGGGGDDGVAVPVGGDELGCSGGLACTAGAVGSLQRAARSAWDEAPGPAAGNAVAQPSAGVRGAPGGARGD